MKRQVRFAAHLAELLWRGLADWRLTVLVSIWLSIVAAFAAIIPDLPSAANDPRVLSRWLADMPAQVWPVVTWLRGAGFLPIHTSLLYRLPLAVLLSHSLVAMAFWSPSCYRRACNGRDDAVGKDGDEVESAFRVFRWLPSTHASPINATDGEGQGKDGAPVEGPEYEEKRLRQRCWLALPGMYLGLGLVSLGLLLTGWLGRASDWRLKTGSVESFGPGQSWRLTLDQVSGPAAGPSARSVPQALVTVSPPFGEPRRMVLSLNRGHLVGLSWLALVGAPPVAELSAARTGTGEPLSLYPLASPDRPDRTVRLPLSLEQGAAFAGVVGRGLMVAVEAPVADVPAAGIGVSVLRGVETVPAYSTVVNIGDEFTFDGIQFRLGLDQEAEIRVRPGLWWLPTALGGGILVACLLLLMLLPPLRLRRVAGSTSGRTEETWLLEGPSAGDLRTLPDVRTGLASTPSALDVLRLGMVVLTVAVTGLSLFSWWTQAEQSATLGRWLVTVWLVGLAAWARSTFVHESARPFRG